jgi:hypothetical protein
VVTEVYFNGKREGRRIGREEGAEALLAGMSPDVRRLVEFDAKFRLGSVIRQAAEKKAVINTFANMLRSRHSKKSAPSGALGKERAMPDTKHVFKDDTLYPPEASARGDNAHYLDYCEAGGHRPGYAVCLNKIRAVEERRLEGLLGGCETAITGRTCPAFHLRDKERLEGRALYYISRSRLNEHIAELNRQPVQSTFLTELKEAGNASRAKVAAKRTEPVKPQPAPLVASMEGGYAAAINAAMAETVAGKPEPIKLDKEQSERFEKALDNPPAANDALKGAMKTAAAIGEPLKPTGSAPTIKPLPGESMLEFAKRMREARATA